MAAVSDQKVLASAATAASYTMVVQFTFRICTFLINGVMLRYVTRETLGVVNVRLTLLYATPLFVASEPFLRACLSKAKDGQRCWPQLINLLWCSFPFGLITAIVLGTVWTTLLEQPDAENVPYYSLAVVCYAASSIIEMLIQPLHVIGQILLYVRAKTVIDSIALSIRCLLTVVLVVVCPHWGLISFCVSQLTYSLTMMVLYYTFFFRRCRTDVDFPLRTVRDFFPSISSKPFVSGELRDLTWSFTKQSLLKQILTEGERYLMTLFGILSFPDQGVYDIVNNLGSLAARFLFLPIEDGLYLFLSQTMHRGDPATSQDQNSMRLVTGLVEALLRLLTYVGLTFLVFGYSYSFLLLDIYGGTLLSGSSGPMLLRWFCLYVLLIAINGVTEGFKNATMRKSQVDAYNQTMLYFAFGFLTSAFFLTHHFGSVGFILANCLNMSSRIIHSCYYIHKFYDGYNSQPLRGIIVSRSVLLAYIASLVVTVLSESAFCCGFGWVFRVVHIGIGGMCFMFVIGVIWFKEHELIRFVREQYAKRHEIVKVE